VIVPPTPPTIVHHMAALDGTLVPNSLEAIRACLAAGAAIVEIDVMALAEGDYLLVHDPRLESETTGTGLVSGCPVATVTGLRFVRGGRATDVRVPLLSEVVRLFGDTPGQTRLHVDYKNTRPFAEYEPLGRLVALLAPLGPRVIVSSKADWQLRHLRDLAPWLDLGLDVHFHLDHRSPSRPETERRYPPYRLGAYGYWDDHPLAAERVWPAAEYLADRCATIAGLVPGISTVYISHRLLVQSLDDGFNWAEALHRRGIRLDAWTLDVGDPVAEANARRLLAAGVDLFTTNTPAALAALLAQANGTS
jgi:glycerophosphoryl diester phosphodiesterase